MTDRKKKGLALVVTGAVCVAAGVVLIVTAATPLWIPVAILVVDVALSAIGLPLLFKPEA